MGPPRRSSPPTSTMPSSSPKACAPARCGSTPTTAATSPLRSAATSSPASVATSRCTPSTSSPRSRRPGSSSAKGVSRNLGCGSVGRPRRTIRRSRPKTCCKPHAADPDCEAIDDANDLGERGKPQDQSRREQDTCCTRQRATVPDGNGKRDGADRQEQKPQQKHTDRRTEIDHADRRENAGLPGQIELAENGQHVCLHAEHGQNQRDPRQAEDHGPEGPALHGARRQRLMKNDQPVKEEDERQRAKQVCHEPRRRDDNRACTGQGFGRLPRIHGEKGAYERKRGQQQLRQSESQTAESDMCRRHCARSLRGRRKTRESVDVAEVGREM